MLFVSRHRTKPVASHRVSSAKVASPATAPPTSSCWFEPLESRALASAAPTTGAVSDALKPLGVVYVETNNPEPGQNAVLAYSTRGKQKLIGSFPTGGTGFLNANDRLGPNDNDRPIIVSADRRFLYAVNTGDDTLSAFTLGAKGALTAVGGGNIDSGGVQPVSLEIIGDQLYVLNKGDVGPFETGTTPPTISIFSIDPATGALASVTPAAVTLPGEPGSTPSQLLASPDGSQLWVDGLFIDPTPEHETQLFSYLVGEDGTLTPHPGSPVGVNNLGPGHFPSLEGLAYHPSQNIIYAGLPQANGVAVFTYDATGQITYVDSQPSSVVEACWTTVDRAGKYLYVANSAGNAITTYSLADPLRPVQVQALVLRDAQIPAQGTATFGGLPHQFSLDPRGKRLYVLSQEHSADNSFPEGNALHILKVGRNGRLKEARQPLEFGEELVPANAHPHGVVVL